MISWPDEEFLARARHGTSPSDWLTGLAFLFGMTDRAMEENNQEENSFSNRLLEATDLLVVAPLLWGAFGEGDPAAAGPWLHAALLPT